MKYYVVADVHGFCSILKETLKEKGFFDDKEPHRTRIDRLYMELRIADDQEREVLYDRIAEEKAERDRQVSKWLTSSNVLIFVVRHYEKNRPSDWRIYAPIVNSKRFKDFMLKGGSPIGFVEENIFGKISVYGKKFARKW